MQVFMHMVFGKEVTCERQPCFALELFFFSFNFETKTNEQIHRHILLRQIKLFILYSEVLWAVKKYSVFHQGLAFCRNVSHATKDVRTPA